jgi:hypothetical protein
MTDTLFFYLALPASLLVIVWLLVWFVQEVRAERAHRKRQRMAVELHPSQWRPNVRRVL